MVLDVRKFEYTFAVAKNILEILYSCDPLI